MRNLLKKSRGECERVRDLLELSVATRAEGATAEELLEALPAAERSHAHGCAECREEVRILIAVREVFEGIGSRGEVPKPWFATRVMAAISARERELAISPWMAVPRLAARVAWVSAIVLLAGSTLLYEKPGPTSSMQPSASASQESLFEAPAQVNQDDPLLSMTDNNP